VCRPSLTQPDGGDRGQGNLFQPTRPCCSFFIGSDLFRIHPSSVFDSGRLGTSVRSMVGATIIRSRTDGHQLAPTRLVQVNSNCRSGGNFGVRLCLGGFSRVLFGTLAFELRFNRPSSAPDVKAGGGSRNTAAPCLVLRHPDLPSRRPDRRGCSATPVLNGTSDLLSQGLRLSLVEEGGSRCYCAPPYWPVALACRSCQRPPDAGLGAETKK
jgi:hypothetical protein